jgi:ribosomal protein S18 acetylase RimI-like enzyme
MKLRYASDEDIQLLAELNHQLIQDERVPNPMSVRELAERMRAWLGGDYRPVVFELAAEPIAYALFRTSEEGIYLRQFYVSRANRRRGVGRRAIEIFREQVVSSDQALSLEVFVHNEAGVAFWQAVGFEQHTLSFRIGPKRADV